MFFSLEITPEQGLIQNVVQVCSPATLFMYMHMKIRDNDFSVVVEIGASSKFVQYIECRTAFEIV